MSTTTPRTQKAAYDTAASSGHEAARGTGEGHSAAPQRIAGPRVSRLAETLAAYGGDTSARARELADFWIEVESAGTPLVESLADAPDHRAVTFLWRGDEETRDVLLVTNRLIDRSDYASGLMERIPGTDVWHFTFRLRADHHGSYRIGADQSQPDTAGHSASGHSGSDQSAARSETIQDRLRALAVRSVPDPLNPRTIATRWNDAVSSVFALPQAPPQPWTEHRAAVPRGTVERHRTRSDALGDEREVWLYLPPRPWPADLDLLVLLDGDMWFGQLPGADLFDNLHADGAVRPLAVLAPDAVDNPTRMREFGGRQSYTDFLTEELLPWAAGRLPLTWDPSRISVAGQSLGGITALYVGLAQRRPRVGNVIAQSASLWWHPDVGPGIPSSMDDGDQWLTREFISATVREGLRLRLDVGVHEGAMAGMNRRLHERLVALGYDSTLTEYNGGHDYVCWRGALADGLAVLHAP